jgi:hypothetical protein
MKGLSWWGPAPGAWTPGPRGTMARLFTVAVCMQNQPPFRWIPTMSNRLGSRSFFVTSSQADFGFRYRHEIAILRSHGCIRGGFLFALHVPAHRSDGLVPVWSHQVGARTGHRPMATVLRMSQTGSHGEPAVQREPVRFSQPGGIEVDAERPGRAHRAQPSGPGPLPAFGNVRVRCAAGGPGRSAR